MKSQLSALLALTFVLGGAPAGSAQTAPDSTESAPGVSPSSDLWPFRPAPGWFVGAEAFLVRPTGWGFAGLDFKLDQTVSPRAVFGYRFEEGNALLASYRYLGGSGTDNYPGIGGFTSSRLDSHWLDLDYRGTVHGPWLFFTFQWQAGCRLASLEETQDQMFPGSSNRTHESFLGAGPHFGTDLEWYLARTGVGVFAREDIGLLLIGNGGLQLRAEVGVSYSPAAWPGLRLEGGVQVDDSLWGIWGPEFNNTGPFLRCEVGF